MRLSVPGKFQRNNSKSSKLTATQVQDIRALYARGDCTQGELSRDYQVSIVQIGRILRGESWQHLPALPPSSRQIEESGKRMLEVQREAREEEETGGIARLNSVASDLFKSDEMVKEIKETVPTAAERLNAYGFPVRKLGEKK